MPNTFHILRSLAVGVLTFAAILGLVVAGLTDGLGAFWIGLTSSVVCVLMICGLYELD